MPPGACVCKWPSYDGPALLRLIEPVDRRDVQGLLHVGKRKLVRLARKIIQQAIGELDALGAVELVLPVDGIIAALGLRGIGEIATSSADVSV